MLTFDQMGDLLDRLMEKFPPELFEGLNGGVLLLPEAKPDMDTDGDLYIMGEYCHDMLGRYINLYYGSFAETCGDLTGEELEEELSVTVSHELTHHIESLAGERGLELKDEAFMDDYWQQRAIKEEEESPEV